MLCHTIPLLAALHGGPEALERPGTPDDFPQLHAAANGAPQVWRPDTLGYVDSDTHNVRCHWAEDEFEQYCDAVVEAAEIAWDTQTAAGFPEPFTDEGLGGSDAVDIYLETETTGGGAYAYCMYTGENAYTICDDADETDGRSGSSAYIAIDPNIGQSFLASYVAHEFNHVLQYAIDFNEPVLPFWEGTATAAQSWTLGDDASMSPIEVWDFQAVPWASLFSDGYMLWKDLGLWSYYEYGAEIWFHHYESMHGDGTGSATANLWLAGAQEGATNEPDILDAWEAETGDWQASFLSFVSARGRIGTANSPDWASSWLDEAAEVNVLREMTPDIMPSNVNPNRPPEQLGALFFDISGLATGQTIDVTIDSEAEVEWAVVFIDGAEEAVEAPVSVGQTVSYAPTDGDARVAVVNLGPNGWDIDTHDWGALWIMLSAAELEINFAVGEGGKSQDTGDTGTPNDTGAANDTGNSRPPKGDDEKPGACGCNTGAGWGWGLLALPLVAFRRRECAP